MRRTTTSTTRRSTAAEVDGLQRVDFEFFVRTTSRVGRRRTRRVGVSTARRGAAVSRTSGAAAPSAPPRRLRRLAARDGSGALFGSATWIGKRRHPTTLSGQPTPRCGTGAPSGGCRRRRRDRRPPARRADALRTRRRRVGSSARRVGSGPTRCARPGPSAGARPSSRSRRVAAAALRRLQRRLQFALRRHGARRTGEIHDRRHGRLFVRRLQLHHSRSVEFFQLRPRQGHLADQRRLALGNFAHPRPDAHFTVAHHQLSVPGQEKCHHRPASNLRHPLWLQHENLVAKLDLGPGENGNIKNETAGRFYKTVAVMTEYEVGFAHFLLPHVLFQKVIENDFDEVLNEVLKVLHSFNEKNNLEKSFCSAACQVVFSSTDFLRKWANRARAWPEKDTERGYIMNFLNSIPKNLLAECAMLCNAYTRSLMYYEMYLDSSNANIEEHMPFLQKLYAYLEDVDAVKGSLTFRIAHGKPTLHEYILTYESIGNYHDALPYHEAVTDAYPDDLSNHIAFVQCMLKLNQVTVSLRYIDGLRSENKEWSERLHLCRAETLRRLQSWDLLKQEIDEVEINHPSSVGWDADLGRLMLCVKERKCDSFQAEMSAVRSRIMDEISVAMMDFASYERIYGSVLKLHQLYEVQQFLEQVGRAGEEDPNAVLTNLGHCWDSRLKLLQHSSNVRHPVLELRRQLLDFWPRCDETIEMIGSSWLRSAKVARKAGHLQSAWSYLAKVKGKNFDAVFVEEAKLLWLKNEQGEALSCLENGISSRFSKLFISPNQAEADEHRPLFAKAQLLLANYARDSSSRDAFEVLDLYKKLLNTCPDNEQGYYNTAVHLDQIAQTHSYRHSYHIVLPKMVSSYGKSLKYGLKNLHHSMPRLLTLWLDSTARLHQKQTKSKGDRDADVGLSESDNGQKMELLNSLNKIVRQLSDELPVQLFYSCFSQLISRVCHPADSTAEILKTIIARVIATFPQQGLWMSLSVATSTNPQRRQACKEVYEKAMALNARVKPLLEDMTEFLELLKKLCYSAAGARRLSLSMSQDFPKLNSYFSNRRASRPPIILPMQSMMDINMSVLKLSNSACSDQKPVGTSFPIQPVYIAGFADTVEILSSLQKPKKILIVCTDGKTYPMMCKAKDDLRLDKRLMEFNNLKCRVEKATASHPHLHGYSAEPRLRPGGVGEQFGRSASHIGQIVQGARRFDAFARIAVGHGTQDRLVGEKVGNFRNGAAETTSASVEPLVRLQVRRPDRMVPGEDELRAHGRRDEHGRLCARLGRPPRRKHTDRLDHRRRGSRRLQLLVQQGRRFGMA
ncbi:hypothetical protein Tsp_00544 [Trichinella spiralis]|uniref:hypothetical protein n=1 Tax=Trichinella spiralis TaxID=6334 RepID=UPI0001EFBC75|nr:hypothetical protein Tsp_00544 [Trichinella spiralis]